MDEQVPLFRCERGPCTIVKDSNTFNHREIKGEYKVKGGKTLMKVTTTNEYLNQLLGDKWYAGIFKWDFISIDAKVKVNGESLRINIYSDGYRINDFIGHNMKRFSSRLIEFEGEEYTISNRKFYEFNHIINQCILTFSIDYTVCTSSASGETIINNIVFRHNDRSLPIDCSYLFCDESALNVIAGSFIDVISNYITLEYINGYVIKSYVLTYDSLYSLSNELYSLIDQRLASNTKSATKK